MGGGDNGVTALYSEKPSQCTPNKNPYCKECFEDNCNGKCKLTEKVMKKYGKNIL